MVTRMISEFLFRLAFGNIVVSDPLSINTEPNSIHCAERCKYPCVSFFYNQVDEKCILANQFYDEGDTGLTNVAGWRYFKFTGEIVVCQNPELINNGRVAYTDGLQDGSTARFICDDYYLPTIMAGVCDVSGAWLGLDTACEQMTTPMVIPAEGCVVSGSCVTVLGTPTSLRSFGVLLLDTSGDKSLIVNPRFDYSGYTEKIIRTSVIGGSSATFETNTPTWPFQMNVEFNMTICMEYTQYKGFVDGVEMFTYTFRKTPVTINRVQINNDVTVRGVFCPHSLLEW